MVFCLLVDEREAATVADMERRGKYDTNKWYFCVFVVGPRFEFEQRQQQQHTREEIETN